MADLVLVTGASGFIAGHCIIALVNRGYRVRGTLRSLSKADHIRKTLAPYIDCVDNLEFAAADLSNDKGWVEAAAGCDYLIHMASPLPRTPPKSDDELILPARDGALRVLQAGVTAGVKRIVMTSSVAAVLYGLPRDGSRVYDDSDWSQLQPWVGAYEKSKTIAERAAWEYMKNQSVEFTTINPGLVLGPILEADYGTSGELVRKLMLREIPGIPDVGWAVVDVRDVADAHVAALRAKNAPGYRHICTIGHVSMREVAAILKEVYEPRGYKIPTMHVPGWLLRIVGKFDKTASLAVQELGLRQDVDVSRTRENLGWNPRTLRTMVVDMAESMIKHKVV